MGEVKIILSYNKEFIKQEISSLLPDTVYEIDRVKHGAIKEKKVIVIDIAKNLNGMILKANTKLSEIVKPLRGLVSERFILECIVIGSSRGSSLYLLYKHFPICIKRIYLQNKYLIKPYTVGKDKKSLIMVMPSKIIKSLKINPQSVFFLLKVMGVDTIHLHVIREEDLVKEDVIPVAAGTS